MTAVLRSLLSSYQQRVLRQTHCDFPDVGPRHGHNQVLSIKFNPWQVFSFWTRLRNNYASRNDVGKWSHWLVHCTCKYLINSVQASPNHRSKVCETSQLVLAAHVHQLEHSRLTGLPWSIRKWLQKKTRSSEVLPKLVFRHVSSLGISWNADNTHLRLHCWDWWIYVNLPG